MGRMRYINACVLAVAYVFIALTYGLNIAILLGLI